jgi:hypothetical protein
MPVTRLVRGLQISLTILLVTAIFTQTVPASDRDTPAYRIYVDPVTGRYSTKPPEQQGAQTGQPATAQPTSPAIPVTIGALPNGPDLRRPLKAVLLLVGIAALSLLARAWKSSRSA